MNKIKKIILPLFICLLSVVSVFLSIYIPKKLLKNKTEADMSVVMVAPEDYYLSGQTAMARNTSMQLNAIDRMNLITGAWESNMEACTVGDSFLTESDAVSLAKSQLEIFYDAGVYPYSLESTYNNWYSWNTKLYKFTDAAFNTYSAYLWVITFNKFDNSLSHTVIMTESGTILNAEVNDNTARTRLITNAYTDSSIGKVLGLDNLRMEDLLEYDADSKIQINYPDLNTDDITFKKIYRAEISYARHDPDSYYIYQYSKPDAYGIGITLIAE